MDEFVHFPTGRNERPGAGWRQRARATTRRRPPHRPAILVDQTQLLRVRRPGDERFMGGQHMKALGRCGASRAAHQWRDRGSAMCQMSGRRFFAHTPSPAPTIFELTPSPALHYRLRNIVSDGSRTLGCNAASSLHEATDPLTGAWSDQPATSAAAIAIPPPNVLMSALSSALRGPDSAQSLQQSLLIPRAPNSSSALATSVTAGRPPVPPRPLRKCCVCNEEKRTKFLCLTASWLKAAFVLLGRPFPGCFGTSSQACRFPTVHFRRDAFVCNDMLCV